MIKFLSLFFRTNLLYQSFIFFDVSLLYILNNHVNI
jgi:hypothetical protein